MARLIITAIATCLCLATLGYGGDLYKVTVSSHHDAEAVVTSGAEAIVLVTGGYLILADTRQADILGSSGLKTEFLAANVEKNQLALDNRRDDLNTTLFPIVYSDGNLRLYRVADAQTARSADGLQLIPIHNDYLIVRYKAPKYLNEAALFQTDGLQEIIDRVDYDTAYNYLHQLQAFGYRVAGTSPIYNARDWIAGKFSSYGYAGVDLENFTGLQLWAYNPVSCYNVVARKIGSRYPNRQIVIGAHYDAVPGSPGADDNGTGTTGVMEIARALADVETEMTVVFVTFDSEESGLHGAWYYADNAAAAGDSIVCMFNMDMIGHHVNDQLAAIHYGPEDAYAELWIRLADSLVGIEGVLAGSSSHSDHYPFVQNGYDVAYAAEYYFSNVYHSYQDSTTYVNFDYMTRMIKGVLAAAYAVATAPMPTTITSVRDGGDGQSLQVNWQVDDGAYLDHTTIYYDTEPSTGLDSVVLPTTETSAMLTGLNLGQQYKIYVIAYDLDGDGSVIYTEEYGTPNVIPAMPQGLVANPARRSIELTWTGNNTELDFSHYTLIRDGVPLPDVIADTFFVDDDFSLGSGYHAYLIVARDSDGNISDTVGMESVVMRAATLDPGRILAVNRSAKQSTMIVDEVRTGEFMRDALTGYDYDYLSDTAHGSGSNLTLVEMLDYEVVIFGAESGRSDDLGADPVFGGILDTIGRYMSIGGKVIVFGRWSDLYTSGDSILYTNFQPGDPDYGYTQYFDIDYRTQLLSSFTATTINSELIGAISLLGEYPGLTWDSLAAADHSSPWVEVTGIPCPSLSNLTGADVEPIYLFESNQGSSSSLHEQCCLGWKDVSEDSQYVFFEIPLSFMERSGANAALQAAVADLISDGPGAQATAIDPDTIDIPAGQPAEVTIYLGDFRSGTTAGDVDAATVRVNNDLIPISADVLPSHPDFTGEVLEIVVDGYEFTDSYGVFTDTTGTVYVLSWNFTGEGIVNFNSGEVTVIPVLLIPGDANGDDAVNVGDAVFVINYVFKQGDAPNPMATGDPNGDCSINVGDAVYLINYVFKSGAQPMYNDECIY